MEGEGIEKPEAMTEAANAESGSAAAEGEPPAGTTPPSAGASLAAAATGQKPPEP